MRDTLEFFLNNQQHKNDISDNDYFLYNIFEVR